MRKILTTFPIFFALLAACSSKHEKETPSTDKKQLLSTSTGEIRVNFTSPQNLLFSLFQINGQAVQNKSSQVSMATFEFDLRRQEIPTSGTVNLGCSKEELSQMVAAAILSDKMVDSSTELAAQDLDSQIRQNGSFEAHTLVICGSHLVDAPLRIFANKLILSAAELNLRQSQKGVEIRVNVLTMIDGPAIEFGPLPDDTVVENYLHVSKGVAYYKWDRGEIVQVEPGSESRAQIDFRSSGQVATAQ